MTLLVDFTIDINMIYFHKNVCLFVCSFVMPSIHPSILEWHLLWFCNLQVGSGDVLELQLIFRLMNSFPMEKMTALEN